MDILTAIHTRASVRKYTGDPVSEEDVAILLDAAMAAPSAGNEQPWQFIVIDDRGVLEKIPEIHPYGGMAKNAPLAILVCGDRAAEKHPGFWVQDCSAAIQNMLLAAVARNLGAVWTGIYPVEERVAAFGELFGLPDHVTPLGLVILGKPDAKQEAKSRFRADRVRRNHW